MNIVYLLLLFESFDMLFFFFLENLLNIYQRTNNFNYWSSHLLPFLFSLNLLSGSRLMAFTKNFILITPKIVISHSGLFLEFQCISDSPHYCYIRISLYSSKIGTYSY